MQPSSHQPSPEYSHRARARTVRAAHHSPSPEPKPEDAAARTAKFHRRLRLKRRLTPWEWGGFIVSLIACICLWQMVLAAEGDLSPVRERVREKQSQLAALERQNDEEKNHLAHLRSEKGREQLLVERGYHKPGDRFLLFPSESQEP